MKKVLAIELIGLIVFSALSVSGIRPVSAPTNDYVVFSQFNPGVGPIWGCGGYVEYYGVPEWGDEIQHVYFVSGTIGYKYKVWVTNEGSPSDLTPYIDIRQHPNSPYPSHVGPVEPRHFEYVSSKNLAPYSANLDVEEFHVDSTGVYLGPNVGIHKWDHDWNYVGQIGPAFGGGFSCQSLAYNAKDNIWYTATYDRRLHQLSDTDGDGNLMDESWQYVFTYPNYGGGHHDGMEYVGGYLWISDMTIAVIGKWQYNSGTHTWTEVGRYTYPYVNYVEGMGFGPNDHFWMTSGFPGGGGSIFYEVGDAITMYYPIADAGEDVQAHPPTIPVKFDGSGSHHTDPSRKIASYEWDFDGDGIWDYSFGRFVYPTGKAPTMHRDYGYDGAITYYEYSGWLARGEDYKDGYYHIGQDIPANVGDTVFAIADGEVISISGPGYSHGWDHDIGDNNVGILVKHKLSDETEFLALYGHVHSSVSIGDRVIAGEAFATIGPWGSKPHLHFGIHPGAGIPPSPWGALEILSGWPDISKSPSTNGFVDPIEWMNTQSPLETSPLYVTHAYPAYYNPDGSINWGATAKTYTVYLKVTDDDPVAPKSDVDTCEVHITAPPWKPVADPDGPYTGYKGVPVQLDGSKSYDPESKMFPVDHPWYETIATYEWDLNYDGQFDDATGTMPTYTWNTAGLYIIGLKVTDSQPSGAGSTVGPLDIDTRYTTAVITETQPPIGDLAEETVSNYIQSADVNGDGRPDFGWNSGYDISFVSQTLNIEINIQLVGDDPGDALRQQWHDGIEGIWSNTYDIVDGLYTYPIEVSVNWVDTNPHHAVTVHDMLAAYPDHWINMLNWYTQVPHGADHQDEIAAHEAGHMLGVYDEYAGGALDPDTLLVTTNSLMADLGPTWERHYQRILEWLETRSGRDLSLAQSPLPPYPLDNPIPDFTDPMDNIPPTTTLTIGEPKYIDSLGNIYVCSATLFTLNAEDNPGGWGVATTAYCISNSTYDSGWQTYTTPFHMTSLADGVYTIRYNSTDNVGNVETTQAVTVTLFSWKYVFEDSSGRGTILRVNTEHGLFQFVAPDTDYGLRDATFMFAQGNIIRINHDDGQLRIIAVAVGGKLDVCIASAYDRGTDNRYLLVDKAGVEVPHRHGTAVLI